MVGKETLAAVHSTHDYGFWSNEIFETTISITILRVSPVNIGGLRRAAQTIILASQSDDDGLTSSAINSQLLVLIMD